MKGFNLDTRICQAKETGSFADDSLIPHMIRNFEWKHKNKNQKQEINSRVSE